MRQRVRRAIGRALALVSVLGGAMMVWLDVLQFAVNVALVALLATDIVMASRLRMSERVRHIEEFLRFAKKPR